MDRTKILLGMPRGSNMLTDGAAKGFFLYPSQKYAIGRIEASSSASNHTFNSLWAAAMNFRADGFRYFAMIHSDVGPEQFWIDKLMDILLEKSADVVSAVIPIRSEEGLTSTAVDKGDLWNPCRLTMTEVMALPETFNSYDVGYPLLVNNGLWICDITKPWVEKFSFETLNRIGRTKENEFFAQTIPEDWLCSRKFSELGLSVYATRAVSLDHNGYRNDHAWGTWATDEAYYESIKEVPQCA